MWRRNGIVPLKYGIRYVLFHFAQPSVKNPDPGLAAAGLDTSRINLDQNNLAGRFGFAYKLTQSGRAAIRGGDGTVFRRTPSILTGATITHNGIQVEN